MAVATSINPGLGINPHTHQAAAGPWKAIAGLLVFFYLTTFAFEGLVRYTLDQAGAGSYLYLRDAVPVLIVAGCIYAWMAGFVRPTLLLLAVLLLLIHFFIGYYYLGGLFQRMFGFKVFLPFLLGVAYCVATDGRVNVRYIPWILGALVVSATAVIVNKFIAMPWEGAQFESVFGIAEQARNSTTLGVRRLTGLARAAYDAASVILVCMVIVLAHYRKPAVKLIVWVIAVVAIALTTTKAALLAALVVGVCVAFYETRRASMISRTVIAGALLLCVGMPILSLYLDVSTRAVSESYAWWLSSFADRMENMWPRAFEVWTEHGNVLIGRGLGGLGFPQRYGSGEWKLFNVADNLFVYWTVIFGVLGWVYASVLLWRLFSWKPRDAFSMKLVYGFMAVLFSFGLTANIVEQPILLFSAGFCFALVWNPTKDESPCVESAR